MVHALLDPNPALGGQSCSGSADGATGEESRVGTLFRVKPPCSHSRMLPRVDLFGLPVEKRLHAQPAVQTRRKFICCVTKNSQPTSNDV